MKSTQKKEHYSNLPAVKESWILAMLSRDSGHFSNLRRNRNKLTKYRQKSDFFAARNRFEKTFYDIFFFVNDSELQQKFPKSLCRTL